MPANIRELKESITSVKKTKQITQAMKMVSAAKFKRNVLKLDHVKEYGQGLNTIINSLSKRLYPDDMPDLLKTNDSLQVALIVISSDRGLCGGFNANLNKEINRQLKKYQQLDLYIVGNKAYQFFKNKNTKIIEHAPNFNTNNGTSEIDEYMKTFIDNFKQGIYSKVLVVYNEFISALSTKQVVKQLLPVSLPDYDPDTITQSDFIYESSKASALNSLLSRYSTYVLKRAVLESQASEEGARMAAMDSATSNANEMIDELTLYFNRSRQAAITTELTEIVAGAASLS